MILYDYVLSTSCYKARLMAALLGVDLTLKAVNFYPAKEHQSPELLALNPAGTLPILQDGDLILTQTAAILRYLVLHCDATDRRGAAADWLGEATPQQAALTQEWLAFSSALHGSLGLARLHDMLQFPADGKAVRADGRAHLRQFEAHLADQRFAGHVFVTGASPTIADIACFPDVMLAGDGGISLDPYPAIRLWTRAIRSLSGFVEMPGIYRLHEQAADPAATPTDTQASIRARAAS